MLARHPQKEMNLKSTRLLASNVVYCAVTYYLCHFFSQVALSTCEVTLVTRNYTDSFRIGKDDCERNEIVCTTAGATCQDDGLCLCDLKNPHFRNPKVIIANSSFRYGNSYGCLTSVYMRQRVGEHVINLSGFFFVCLVLTYG